MFTETQLLRLSQGQLNLLERCPRQFQHTYLDQLGSPSTPEQQERMTWGSRFHLLMQQRELNLPIDFLVEEDAQMRNCITAFASAAPSVFTPQNTEFRESEHCRTLKVQDYLLTVIYDLLIADDGQAQILDWKTYPKPQGKRSLAQNWQTLLYRYVLAETSDYSPEQISMTYWFVLSPDQPQSIKFNYNTTQHEKTKQKLNRLLSQLTDWLERYQNGEQFPQIALDNQSCDRCQYVVQCDRNDYRRDRSPDAEPDAPDNMLNLATIQEVSL